MTDKKPSNVLNSATTHFKKQISGEMNSFEVPEWDTTVYFRSVQSLKNETEVVELTRQGKSTEALVVSIINKARHADGSVMFNKHDKATFMNEVDPAVILTVAGKLNAVELPTMEEASKN